MRRTIMSDGHSLPLTGNAISGDPRGDEKSCTYTSRAYMRIYYKAMNVMSRLL